METKYGTDTVAYKAAPTLEYVNNEVSLDLFKSEIKNRRFSKCHCNICRVFVIDR